MALALANLEEVIQIEDGRRSRHSSRARHRNQRILVRRRHSRASASFAPVRNHDDRDEVMSGSGAPANGSRSTTGGGPRLLTMAKGRDERVCALGAVGMRRAIATTSKSGFLWRADVQQHPLACAAALATSRCTRKTADREAKRTGEVMKRLLADLESRTTSSGDTLIVCSASWKWSRIEGRRNRRAMQGTRSDAETGTVLPEQGLYTFVRWNTFFTNPRSRFRRTSCATLRHLDRGLGEIT